jgi:hypothetical protein
MEWAAGKREAGIDLVRQSLAGFEALAAEDPANAIYVQAGAQVRDYLALMLAKGGAGAEAVKLAERNTRLRQGADGTLHKGRERTFVYQITLGAALPGAQRFSEAERELRETLKRNVDWSPNDDLRWSALHALTQALRAQGKFEEEIAASKEARRFADLCPPEPAIYVRVLRAVAAWDYASAVAHWAGSTADQRLAAKQALDASMARLGHSDAVFTGALLESPPLPSEVAAVRSLLSR